MRSYAFHESPLGRMLIVATDDAISGVYFVDQKYYRKIEDDWREDASHPAIRVCKDELDRYFAGSLTEFGVPVAPEGTPFQRAVWRAIAGVPYGRTITYGRLANEVGGAQHTRAAGTATGRNPISIIIPCHRIVGADGSLTGYAGGLERKSELLALESGVQSLALS